MFNIQSANPTHIPLIRKIAENTWWKAYGQILPAGQIKYMLDTLYAEETIRQQMEEGSQSYLLLQDGDMAIGFASFAPREPNIGVYKLHKLYCLPAMQERGCGRLLVQAVEGKVVAGGGSFLELNVNRNNKAKGFYEKMGFSIAYEEDIPIGDYWMNDYVMRKGL